MSLRLAYTVATGQFEEAMKANEKAIAKAATATIREASDLIKARARANIAAAGFSSGWQNAFRATVFPKSGYSINAAAFFTHKIPYFNVFEEGAAIAGKPFLWLPLPNVPLGPRGKKPLTPKQYIERIGPLVKINAGGRPLLVGKGSRKTILRVKRDGDLKLRKKAATSGKIFGANVPLFVGIDTVTIGKKFGVAAIVRDVQAQLGAIYLRHINSSR